MNHFQLSSNTRGLDLTDCFLTASDVRNLIKLSRNAISERLNPSNPRYDATFPKPIKLGERNRWLESEIRTWMAGKVSERDNPTPKPPTRKRHALPTVGGV